MADSSDERLLDELIGPLHMHFAAARTVYRHYLQQGRQFMFASALRDINLSARDLLLGKGYLLPPERQQDAADLIAHYEVWHGLWRELSERTRPSAGDPFTFENSFTYPRDAEARLEELHSVLRHG